MHTCIRIRKIEGVMAAVVIFIAPVGTYITAGNRASLIVSKRVVWCYPSLAKTIVPCGVVVKKYHSQRWNTCGDTEGRIGHVARL